MKKWNFKVVLEPNGGASVFDTFKDLQELKEMGIADDSARIKFNGLDLVAGIYEDGYEYLNTHIAIKDGNKQEIINNLPKECDVIHCAIALSYINDALKIRGNETFTEEEMDEIASVYKNTDEMDSSRQR